MDKTFNHLLRFQFHKGTIKTHLLSGDMYANIRISIP